MITNNDTESAIHSEYILSDGMILRELIEYKEIKLADLFPILGPESLIKEILMDKRKLKEKQKLLLAEHFGTSRDIFSGHDESLNATANSHAGDENNFTTNVVQDLERMNYEHQDVTSDNDQAMSLTDNHYSNSMWE
ncbi:hypothetical protein [Fluviispira sanaruensis]|uniref:Uncharacterized protein n=1 Tax=Fluviispira sanaruensis TaxID=2493639 RepID=A0A4P2VHQ6_FLUSA|nr:hypothetical protein [Fluviispira sanaruensis]BBH52466.1 hypothetical protein JCM31447_09070 [Fluviispira sanaruensis]